MDRGGYWADAGLSSVSARFGFPVLWVSLFVAGWGGWLVPRDQDGGFSVVSEGAAALFRFDGLAGLRGRCRRGVRLPVHAGVDLLDSVDHRLSDLSGQRRCVFRIRRLGRGGGDGWVVVGQRDRRLRRQVRQREERRSDRDGERFEYKSYAMSADGSNVTLLE